MKSLSSTNNFPEFTGRICPAPCESSCVLGIHQPAVTIEEIEKHIIEIAFDRGFVTAQNPKLQTGKKVASGGLRPGRPGRCSTIKLCRPSGFGI